MRDRFTYPSLIMQCPDSGNQVDMKYRTISVRINVVAFGKTLETVPGLDPRLAHISELISKKILKTSLSLQEKTHLFSF